MYESPLTTPATNNPFNRDFQNRGAEMQSDLKDTLRSFRDSLAFSFQTLNLTLASMNSSVQSLGTKIGQLSPGMAGQYIPATHMANMYYGGVSKSYAQFAGSQNFAGLLSANQPYTVSPMEFWRERGTEMAFRSGSGALTLGGTALEEGLSLYGGNAIGGYLARRLGMTGAMAGLGMGIIPGMIIGGAMGAIMDPYIAAAQEHNRDVAAVKRMSARFGSPFTIKQAQTATRGIEELAYNEIWNTTTLDSRLNMSGFRDLTMMGLQGNMFHGTTPEELVKQVSAASKVVKFLTGVMGNKDVQETMQMVKQLKDMGVNVFNAPGAASTMGTNAFMYGRTMGVDSASLLNAAANMSTAAFGQFGNPAFVGINPAMKNLAYLQELEKRGVLSAAEVAAGGGIQAMGGRMLDVQARMLNNNGIGGAMLYAGMMQGGGFNRGQFNASLGAGGYFGMLGNAARNITEGGLGSIANALVNKNNLLAQAANSPGGIDSMLTETLRAQFMYLPKGNDINEDVDIAAAALMQMNPGLDSGTARSLATRVIRPSFERNLDATANREAQLGLLERTRAANSPGRMFETPGEYWDRFKGSLYRNFIQKDAANAVDKLTNALDFTYESDIMTNGRTANANTLEMYRWANSDRTAYNRYKDRDMTFSGTDFADAWMQATDRDGFEWIHSGKRGANMILGLATGRSINTLEDRIQTNAIIANSGLWNRITSKDRMSKTEARGIASQYLANSTTSQAIERIFDKYSDNATAWDPIRAAADVLVNQSNSLESLQSQADDAISKATSSIDFQKLAEELYGSETVANQTNAAGKFVMTGGADTIMLSSLQGAEQQEVIRREAARLGMDPKQLTAITAMQYATSTGNNNVALNYAAGRGKAMESLAEAYASLRRSDGYIVGQNLQQLSYNANRDLKDLVSLGFDKDSIGTLLTEGKLEDIDTLSNYASILQHRDLTGEELAGMEKLSPAAKKIADNLVKNGAKGSLFSSNFTNEEIINKLKNQMQLEGITSIRQSLGSFGLGNVSDADMQRILSGDGNLAGYIKGMDAKNNRELQRVQQSITKFENYNAESMSRVLRGKLGEEQFTKLFGTDGITGDQERNKAVEQYALHLSQATSKRQDAQIAQAASVRNSAIDSAVDIVGQAKPYVRVVMVDEEIKTARKKLDENTKKVGGN